MKKTFFKQWLPIKDHKHGRRPRCCLSHHQLRLTSTMWSFFGQFSSCLFRFLTLERHTQDEECITSGADTGKRESPYKCIHARAFPQIHPHLTFAPFHALQSGKTPHSPLPTRSSPYCLVPPSEVISQPAHIQLLLLLVSQPTLYSLKYCRRGSWNCLQCARTDLPRANCFTHLCQKDACVVFHQSFYLQRNQIKKAHLTSLLPLSNNKNIWGGSP